MADERGNRDDEGTPEDVRLVDRLKMQLLIHHRCQPGLAVGHDGVDHPIEQVSCETLVGVDVADLLALHLGHGFDLGRLPLPFGLVVVTLRERRCVTDRAHGDRLGDGRRKARRDQDGVGATAGDHPEDDAEDVDQPVLAAEDDVAQGVLLTMALTMARPGRGGGRGRHGPAQPGSRRGLVSGAPTHRSASLSAHRTMIARGRRPHCR